MELTNFADITNSWWPIVISFIISLIGAIRFYAGGTKCPNDNRLDGQLAIITGASSGIGLQTAKELLRRGAHVIITYRNKDKATKALEHLQALLPQARIDIEHLDIASLASIRKFAQTMQAKHAKLDVLINNAGIIFHQHKLTAERLELTFATNYLGPFLLAHLLLPLLEHAPHGRIVNVAAAAHKLATLDVNNIDFSREFLYRSAFGQTKLMLVAFTTHFAELLRMRGSRVTITAVNPGLVRSTDHLRRSPLGESWMVRASVLPWTWLFLKSPAQGAQCSVYAATDRRFETMSGEYLSDCEPDEPNAVVQNHAVMRQLYKKSCELCTIEGIDDGND